MTRMRNFLSYTEFNAYKNLYRNRKLKYAGDSFQHDYSDFLVSDLAVGIVCFS